MTFKERNNLIPRFDYTKKFAHLNSAELFNEEIRRGKASSLVLRLSPMEEAYLIARMRTLGMGDIDIEELLGNITKSEDVPKSPASLKQSCKLLKLDPEMQFAVHIKELPCKGAHKLADLPDKNKRAEAYQNARKAAITWAVEREQFKKDPKKTVSPEMLEAKRLRLAIKAQRERREREFIDTICLATMTNQKVVECAREMGARPLSRRAEEFKAFMKQISLDCREAGKRVITDFLDYFSGKTDGGKIAEYFQTLGSNQDCSPAVSSNTIRVNPD